MSQEWNFKRLQNIVAEQEQERFNQEFKGCDELRWKPATDKIKDHVVNELSRDVSAMTNSAGGTIFYGIDEDKSTHIAKQLDPNPFSPTDPCNPEWLDQVIRSNIEPAPDFRIERVFVNDDPTQGWYYVVLIQQGVIAHQARDRTYWRRNNTTKEKMLHHEVVDVMNRAKGPDLVGRLRCERANLIPYEIEPGTPIQINTLNLDLEVTTRNYLSAEYGLVSLYIVFPLFVVNPTPYSVQNSGVKVGNYEEMAHAQRIDLNWSIHQGQAIYPNLWSRMTSIPIRIALTIANYIPREICLIKTEIHGPNRPVRADWYVLTEHPNWEVKQVSELELDEKTIEGFWNTYRNGRTSAS